MEGEMFCWTSILPVFVTVISFVTNHRCRGRQVLQHHSNVSGIAALSFAQVQPAGDDLCCHRLHGVDN